jgi:small-conductance mechanosensitive channel
MLPTAAEGGQWFGTNWAMSRLISNVGSLLVITVGVMLLLSNLGISITPLLTALGVGSLAVALALQDALGNFFAGIHLIASKTIQPGDYIKLDSGQEGTVMDVGWRATRITNPSGNEILVPNTKLSQAILTNFFRSAPQLGWTVTLSVPWEADLQKVERLILEEAVQVQRSVPGAVSEFVPQLRFTAQTDSSAQLTVSQQSKTFNDRALVTHEFLKRVQSRLRREGIAPPYPHRVVETRTAS